MDREKLFKLAGPICALDLGEGKTSTMCHRCGRGGSVQTGDFAVELVCETKGVGKSDGSTILVEARISDEIERRGVWGVHSRRVRAQWMEGLEDFGPIPDLRQLVAEQPIAASRASVEFEDCECNSVSRILSNPLIVREPEAVSAGAWFLKENPRVMIIGERLMEFLLGFDSSLEYKRVYYEHEYTPPAPKAGEVRWDDLRLEIDEESDR